MECSTVAPRRPRSLGRMIYLYTYITLIKHSLCTHSRVHTHPAHVPWTLASTDHWHDTARRLRKINHRYDQPSLRGAAAGAAGRCALPAGADSPAGSRERDPGTGLLADAVTRPGGRRRLSAERGWAGGYHCTGQEWDDGTTRLDGGVTHLYLGHLR